MMKMNAKVSGVSFLIIIGAVVLNIVPFATLEYYQATAFAPIATRTTSSNVRPRRIARARTTTPPPFSSSSSSTTFLSYAGVPEDYHSFDLSLSEMKASEMRTELESYGISTKSMFDKKEFEQALTEARLEQRVATTTVATATATATTSSSSSSDSSSTHQQTSSSSSSMWGDESRSTSNTNKDLNKKKEPREKWSSKWKKMADTAKDVLDTTMKKNKSSKDSSSQKKSSSSSSSSSVNDSSVKSRPERYQRAAEEGASMKLSRLKQELQDRRISTKAFFEKSDFIAAYANAVADNIPNFNSSSNTANNQESTSKKRDNDVFDSSYKTVSMQAFNPSTILSGDVVIDVTAKTSAAY